MFFKALSKAPDAISNTEDEQEITAPSGQRILVAEDQLEVLAVIVATLKNAGYIVTSATSGDQARDLFQAGERVDLLLTDMVMPGQLQGPTLSQSLRKQDPKLRVVFMSGYASESTVHGDGLRAEDIRMMKPVVRADLLRAIRTSLDS